MDEALPTTLLLILIGFIAFFTIGDRDFATINHSVGNITYRYTQTAGKKGELNDTIYSELENKLNMYGDFEITVLAEKFEEDGSITRLENSGVLNYDLRANGFDILTIYVEAKKNHWLSKLFEISPLGMKDVTCKTMSKSAVYIQ